MAHGDIGPLKSGTAFVVRTVGCLAGPGWGCGSRVGTIPGPTQSIAGLGNRISLRCPKLGKKLQQLWRTTFLPQSFFGRASSSILE